MSGAEKHPDPEIRDAGKEGMVIISGDYNTHIYCSDQVSSDAINREIPVICT